MSAVRTSSGHVLSVQSRSLGSALDGDHTAGVTVLTVQDCADFDDNIGGSLTLNDTTYAYDIVDDDASTVAISPPLVADASDGDAATLLDPILGSPQYTVTAFVTEDGEDPGDPIEADIASHLVEQLPEGVRGVAGEAVTLTWDEDDAPTITGLAGINDNQAGFVRGYQDSHVTSSSADLTFNLTYQPIGTWTVHLYWNGVLQEDDTWSIDQWTVTVSDPGGLVQTGDRFYVKYLYLDATTKPVTPASLELVGATSVGHGATSISMPAGVVAGDLLVLTMVGVSTTAATCTDSRFVSSHPELVTISGRHTTSWIGYGFADGSGSAVPISIPTSSSPSASRAELVAFRTVGAISSEYTALHIMGTDFSPARPVADLGITALVSTAAGTTQEFGDDANGEWVSTGLASANGHDNYASTFVCYCLAGTPAGSWAGVGSSAIVAGLTIGLTGT